MSVDTHETLKCVYRVARDAFEVKLISPKAGVHVHEFIPVDQFLEFSRGCLSHPELRAVSTPPIQAMLADVLDGAWREYQGWMHRN